jgi:heptosyltransferase-1
VKALFIKPSSLGDIVHGLQLVESLRHDLSDLNVSWVARDIFAPIVRACNTVDEVFVFNRRGGIRDYLRLVAEVRNQEFDWVIDLQGLFRSGLLTFLSKGKNKLGRADAREFAGLFYHKKSSLPPHGKESHALDILLQFRKNFGLNPEPKGKLSFDSFLPEGVWDLNSHKKTLLFFPESRRIEKEWPYFDELTSYILSRHSNFRIIWAGVTKLAFQQNLPDDRFLNLSGITSIETLPALIDFGDLVLANDSGPMHLAAALGRPVLSVFGPTNPKRFGPYLIDGNCVSTIAAEGGDLKNLSCEKVYRAMFSMTGLAENV